MARKFVPAADGDLDVDRPADSRDGVWFRRKVIVLVASAVLLDGFDNRLLPLALPLMQREWAVDRSLLVLATFAGLLGIALGTITGGVLGDRLGRRPVIIGSVALFGVMTLANAIVGDVAWLSAVRFVAGLGLGSVLPACAAMFAEFAPANRRTLAVTLGMVCVPLGSVISGLLSASLLPRFGWPSVFAVGGVGGLGVAAALAALLPESPSFLRSAKDRPYHDRKSFMGRIRLLHPGDQVARVDDYSGGRSARGLLGAEYIRDTLALWVALFAALTCVYLESQWMPTILSDAGYNVSVTSAASSCASIGTMLSCILGVMAVGKFGSRKALVAMSSGGVLLLVVLTCYPMNPAHTPVPLLLLLGVSGFLIGGLQVMLYAVGAQIYPTTLRSAGIGWAAGVGRFGPMLSPVLALAAFESRGSRSLFALMAASLAVAVLALLQIRRHVPRRSTSARAEAEAVPLADKLALD